MWDISSPKQAGGCYGYSRKYSSTMVGGCVLDVDRVMTLRAGNGDVRYFRAVENMAFEHGAYVDGQHTDMTHSERRC